MRRVAIVALLVCPLLRADEFAESIHPVLKQNCASCHNPENPKNKIDFLKADTAEDMQSNRRLWRSVAAQLRNRTMPPMASKLTEEDRLRIGDWITSQLRASACNGGDYAGPVVSRRLNRREYQNTIRDLIGTDVEVGDIFPGDGTGGEGFDTNGETLYVPPILMERYLQAAQIVVDRAIVTPMLNRVIPAHELDPPVAPTPKSRRSVPANTRFTFSTPVYVQGDYDIRIGIERPNEHPVQMEVSVDGGAPSTITWPRDYLIRALSRRSATFRLERGTHTITVATREHPVEMSEVAVLQRQVPPSAEKRALHYRLMGMEPGETPVNPGRTAEHIVRNFMARAYRRPVEDAEVQRILGLYERSAERGDPYEESVKLALKGILVSPNFLFRYEAGRNEAGLYPLGQYELASRLSFFLWSTMPDEELLRLASAGKLQDSAVLSAQVDRMLDDPRSRRFANAFVGQWLGTQDVGGRVVPLLTELQTFYTPEVAADLREQPILMFHHLVTENKSLLDLIDNDYTFLTERLVRFYQLEDNIKDVQGDVFQRVHWPDRRRGGLLGLGGVLAMSSHYKQTSPVLRGAWVLDALLGTPVPPPPPDVPPLDTSDKKEVAETVREKVMKHRADPACAACHNVMDPIGFALENFDWMGRWRDKEDNGQPVDASGVLPSGEAFNGPVELRKLLLARKDEFVRHLTSKVLGYALGRSLDDADHCTVQKIADSLQADNYGGRTLIREVVLSLPFRYYNGGTRMAEPEPPPPPRRQIRPLPVK
jgi:mono/diheme cytochrome c family protein